MITFLALFAAIVLVLVTHGRLAVIIERPWRATKILIPAFLLQLPISIWLTPDDQGRPITLVLWFGSYGCGLVWLVVNCKLIGPPATGLITGWACNVFVVAINGGVMPLGTGDDTFETAIYRTKAPGDRLTFLADVIRVGSDQNWFSIGDIIFWTAFLVAAYRLSRRETPAPA